MLDYYMPHGIRNRRACSEFKQDFDCFVLNPSTVACVLRVTLLLEDEPPQFCR